MNNRFTLAEWQQRIAEIYGSKDATRGVEGTFHWFLAEVGELAAALRLDSKKDQTGEFADALAWLLTLANVAGVDLQAAIAAKYGPGCPGCRQTPCRCDPQNKP